MASPHAADIVGLLMQMPAWCILADRERQADGFREIEAICRQLAVFDSQTIRQGMEQYIDRIVARDGQLYGRTELNLFVLIEYLFDLPRRVRRDCPTFALLYSGGFWNRPSTGEQGELRDSDEFDLAWPWAQDEMGEWRLVGKFGGYSGPPYEPIETFDRYVAALERRSTRQV